MAKPYYKVQTAGVGTRKQIRSTTMASIPGFDFSVKLSGVDAADLLQGIEEGIENASMIVAEKLSEALDNAMESAVWNWNGGARDIIDTGELRDSKSVKVQGNRIEISYNVPYAGLVHYGGYILPYGNQSAQKVYLPARPWVDSVILGRGPIPQFDFEAIYAAAIEAAF
jgi:hypothetical protein